MGLTCTFSRTLSELVKLPPRDLIAVPQGLEYGPARLGPLQSLSLCRQLRLDELVQSVVNAQLHQPIGVR